MRYEKFECLWFVYMYITSKDNKYSPAALKYNKWQSSGEILRIQNQSINGQIDCGEKRNPVFFNDGNVAQWNESVHLITWVYSNNV